MLNFTNKELSYAEQAYLGELVENAIPHHRDPERINTPDFYPSDQLLRHATDAVRGLIDAAGNMGLAEREFVVYDLDSAMQYLVADRNDWDAGFGDVDMPALEAYAQSLQPVSISVDEYGQMWGQTDER